MLAECPVDRLPSQANQPGDDGDWLTFVVKLADEGFLFLGDLDPCAHLPATPLLAIGLGPGNAGKLPLLADLSFVGGDGRQDAGHEATGGRRQVEALPKRDETDPEGLKL